MRAYTGHFGHTPATQQYVRVLPEDFNPAAMAKRHEEKEASSAHALAEPQQAPAASNPLQRAGRRAGDVKFAYALVAAAIMIAAAILVAYLWWYGQASDQFWNGIFSRLGNAPQHSCPSELIPEAC